MSKIRNASFSSASQSYWVRRVIISRNSSKSIVPLPAIETHQWTLSVNHGWALNGATILSYYYFVQGRWGNYCDQRVCLSVCLSLSARISKNHMSKFSEIFYTSYLWQWLVLLWRQCNKLSTSSFLDDVEFSHKMQLETANFASSAELDETWRRAWLLTLVHCPLSPWRHPQNRKYITCCNVVRGRPSHGHR